MEAIFDSNDVVVISKTSCPYCKAVKALLIEELNLAPKIIEVNVDGPAALDYAKSRTGVSTVPQVFVENKFVGTHDTVMSLDAKGELVPLVEKFMKGPRKQAAAAARGTLLWFPPKVNKSAIRTTGVLSCGIALTSAILMHQSAGEDPMAGYIAAGLFSDYTLRFLAGPKFSPVAQLGGVLAKPFEVIYRPGAPKQFATVCGMMFSGMGAAMFLQTSSPEIGVGFMGVLALCAGMEGFLDFCLGCKFFAIGEYLFAGGGAKATKTA